MQDATHHLERWITTAQQMHALHNAIGWGVLVLTLEGVVLEANETAATITGLTPADLIGTRLADIWQPLDAEARPYEATEWLHAPSLLTGVTVGGAEVMLARKDGQRRVVEFSATTIDDDEGMTVGMVVFCHDVTAERHDIATLRDSMESFRQIFTHCPVPLLILDPAQERVLEANNAACRKYGYSHDEFLEVTAPELLADQDRQAGSDVASPVDSPSPLLIRHRTRSGRILTVEVVRYAFRYAGEPANLMMIYDQSTRLRTEAGAVALASVTEALNRMLEPVEFYRFVLEQAGRVLEADYVQAIVTDEAGAPMVADLDGGVYTLTAVAGTQGLPDLASARPERSQPQLVTRDATSSAWMTWPEPASGVALRHALYVPLRLEQALIGSFTVFRSQPDPFAALDIQNAIGFADRLVMAVQRARLAAQAQQRDKEAQALAALRDDFVAAVSHDLRTPLTAIIGFAELLRAELGHGDTSQLEARASRIITWAHRQQRLIEDLLLLTELEGNGLNPRNEAMVLAPLVDEAIEEIAGAYPGQIVRANGPISLSLKADRDRVLQIIVNLLDNAAKYSPEGTAIEVAWQAVDGMGMVTVRDHGAGIPEESLPLIFTRFGRVPGARRRSGRSGTGLGLYLGRQLAEVMGGTLTLLETGDSGSTFCLKLPLITTMPRQR